MNIIQLYGTGAAILFIGTTLAWSHFHGGVPSHHFLQRKDMPAISNWWGAIWVPLLTWVSIYRMQQRLKKQEANGADTNKTLRNIVAGFLGSLVFGIVLATTFINGYQNITGYMAQSVLVLIFLVPIFRSEYLLGFVLGMTVTIGSVLPSLFAAVVGLVSAVVYNFVRPLLIRLVLFIRQKIFSPSV